MDRDTLLVFANEASKHLDFQMLTGRRLIGTSTTSRAKEPLALDTLRDTLELLRSLGPTPVAIWLVDRPEYKEYIIRHFPLREDAMGSVLGFSISGLRIIDFDSNDYDPSVHRPWCAVPGNYVEMSDGSLLLLKENHQSDS